MSGEPYCEHCGEELCEFGLTEDDAWKDEEGRLYCCDDCLRDAENEQWEARFNSVCPPDYND